MVKVRITRIDTGLFLCCAASNKIALLQVAHVAVSNQNLFVNRLFSLSSDVVSAVYVILELI